MIAQKRWTYSHYEVGSGFWFWRKPGHWVFKLTDGTLFRIVDEHNPKPRIEVQNLPDDYIALGNKAADMKQILGTSEREATARLAEAEATIRHLSHRIDANPDNLVPILAADLEKAINMMMRFAQALGMQAHGPLFDEVQALASKYGMTYREPSARAIHRQAYDRDLLGADVITGELNPRTGQLDFFPHESAKEIDGTATEIHERSWLLTEGDSEQSNG